MKDDIKLPPEFISGNSTPVTVATIKRERMEEILRDAIKADRAAMQSKDQDDIKEVIERLPRYSFGNISDEWGAAWYLGAVRHDNGRFLRVDEVMVAIYNTRRRIEEDRE